MSVGVPLNAERLCYRLNELARMLGICARTIRRQIVSGQFPPPDRKVGRCLLWRADTIDRWLGGKNG